MGSGVFLAIVVVLWFVVLVPMVLTRRDTAREAALPEPLSPAARILSRRSRRSASPRSFAATSSHPEARRFSAMSRRESSPSLEHDQHDQTKRPYELDPQDVVDTGVHARYVDDVEPAPAYDPDSPRPVDPERHRRTDAARELMLARRRRTLVALFVLAVVSLALAVLVSTWFWIPQVIIDLALFGYLYHLRNEAIREQERRDAREERFADQPREQSAPQRRIFSASAQQESETPDERRQVVRIDDEDPTFYDLGYSSPIAHNVDLRGGADASVSDLDRYDDYDDGSWDQRKAVGA